MSVGGRGCWTCGGRGERAESKADGFDDGGETGGSDREGGKKFDR